MSADAGAEHVDPVERRLGVDLFGLALVGEGGVGDLDLEVLLDLVALERRPDREPDLVSAVQRAALDALRDLSQALLGRFQQFGAFAGALRCDERVAAHDQPLAGIVL